MPNSEAATTGVVIHGDGVAACCCAHLLRAAKTEVEWQHRSRARVPAIMLSEAARSLIEDVFGRNDLFRDLHRIHRRVVAWGPDVKPSILPHAALIISEEELTKRLLPDSADVFSSASAAQWTVFAAQPLRHGSAESGSAEMKFGSRMAVGRRAELAAGVDAAACWIESLESGWLFLVPTGERSAWLLAVGGEPEAHLGQSRLIAEQIATLGGESSSFPAFPRIADPLVGPGWLACGTAALRFDPLCGDGTGNAIREAILAAAAIQGANRGLPPDELLAHYRARLLAGFRRHLELCREFYIAGRSGPWWDAEIQLLNQGIAWCNSAMASFSGFRYRLRGFQLEPAGAAAATFASGGELST